MEKKYSIEVSLNEAQLILNGLGELPAKVSLNLIANIQKQVQSQIDTQEASE